MFHCKSLCLIGETFVSMFRNAIIVSETSQITRKICKNMKLYGVAGCAELAIEGAGAFDLQKGVSLWYTVATVSIERLKASGRPCRASFSESHAHSKRGSRA